MSTNNLKRQIRVLPSQEPQYRWRIPNVDPAAFSPTSMNTGCNICPAMQICATHNYIGKDQLFHSDRYILKELTAELIELAAKRIPNIGDVVRSRITADDILASHIAPLLPCTASEKYPGRPLRPNDHNHWIRATNATDPLIEIIKKHKSEPSGHWSDDI